MKKSIIILLTGLVLLSSCNGTAKVLNVNCPNFGYLNSPYTEYTPCYIDENSQIKVNPKILSPFNTFVNYTNHLYESEYNKNKRIIDETNKYLIHLSMCFDRHNLYVNKNNELLKNLAYLNLNYGNKDFIKLEKETYDLLKISYELTLLTEGKFNMAIGELSSLWDDFLKGDSLEIPSKEAIQKAIYEIPSVNDFDELFEFNDSELSVKFNKISDKNISITFGGIAKGRATDLIKEYLDNTRTIVSAGRSSIASYGDSFSDSWGIGIINPLYSYKSNEIYLTFRKQGKFSISTSGDYQNSKTLDGIRYHHIIDPYTGYPSFLHRSVTAIGDNGAYLDAITTSLMLSTKEEGIILLNKLKTERDYDFSVIFMDEVKKENESFIKAYASTSLREYLDDELSKMELEFF